MTDDYQRPTDSMGDEHERMTDGRHAELTEDSRRSVLEEAEAVGSERGDEYGDPTTNMGAIARLWSAYLRNTAGWDLSADPLGPGDVAQMMVLLKVARYQTGDPGNRDLFVDEAGYARVAADVEGVNYE